MNMFWAFLLLNVLLLSTSMEPGCTTMEWGFTCLRTKLWRITMPSMNLDPLIPRITTFHSSVVILCW
ncbi:hypothetical protein BC332_05444 [Capsicum chinense]|nr:hypothetical protein BC332_05444 [Capsicum chinense]